MVMLMLPEHEQNRGMQTNIVPLYRFCTHFDVMEYDSEVLAPSQDGFVCKLKGTPPSLMFRSQVSRLDHDPDELAGFKTL